MTRRQHRTARTAAPPARTLARAVLVTALAAACWSTRAGAQCVAPSAPANPSPAAEASIRSGTVVFTWSPSTGTAPVTYEVLMDGPNVICATPSTSCSMDGVTGSHVWRVVATNGCGSATGGPWGFTAGTSCTRPSTPANPSPAPGATVNSASATLVWSASSGTPPITYEVYLDTTTTPRCTTTSANCTVTGLAAGRHSWYVRASNCGGTSGLAGPWTLTANPPCEAPAAPALSSPAGGALGVGAAPLLQWQPPASGTAPYTYDVYLDEQPVAACTLLAATSCQLGGMAVDAAVHQWRVVARNSCGSASSAARTFATCAQTAVPVATIAIEPSGTVLIGGVPQAQPYAGQRVTLRGSATGGPILGWTWSDVGAPGAVQATQDVAWTWDTPGTRSVRLSATNCAGRSSDAVAAVEIHADVRPVTADFTWSPAPPQAGIATTFTASTGAALGDPVDFAWTFPGGVTRTGAVVEHAFSCAGDHEVTLVARRGDVASAPAARAVAVEGGPPCCAAPDRATSPSPANGATVPGGAVTLRWGRPAQGTDPITYDVELDGVAVPECTGIAARECPVAVADGTATHFWRVVARTACGATTDSGAPSEWRFKACSSPRSPDATTFTWWPAGEVVIGGVVQQQPYVGQEVTFSYDPSVAPTTISWTDYQRVPAVVLDGVARPTIVYTTAGSKKMYLRAANCAGTRTITQYVRVYADQRPVTARFATSPASPAALDLVTVRFDASAAAGDPDEFTVDFGDGTPPETTSAAFAQHVYRCGRTYRITVTARRTRYGARTASAPVSAEVVVAGRPCVPSGFLLVDVPQRAAGADGSQETGAVTVFNPAGETMDLVLSARDAATGALRSRLVLPPLPPKGTLALADLVALAGLDFARATLWVENAAAGAAAVPVVNAWRLVEHASGRRHTQALPAIEVWPPADRAVTLWVPGLVHDSLAAERSRQGAVTRLTFVDPTIAGATRAPWGSRRLTLALIDAGTGTTVRTDSLDLDAVAGYRSDYLNRFFHLADGLALGAVAVRVDVPAGVAVAVAGAVTDAATGSTRVVAGR